MNKEGLNIKIIIKKMKDEDLIHKLLKHNSKNSNKNIILLAQ